MLSASSRLSYMDALRSFLMLLGIVIHTSQIYNPEQSWLIHANDNHVVFNNIIQIISSFRMPAFFIVSGYFCLLILQKSNAFSFFITRVDRLLVPLIVSVLILNVPLAYFLKQQGWLQDDFYNFLSAGGWKQHLWFLINLFIYSTFAAFLYLIPRLRYAILKIVDVITGYHFIILFLLLPFTFVFFQVLNKIGFPIYETYAGISFFEILYYSPFFLLGILIKYNSRFFCELLNPRCLIFMFFVCSLLAVCNFFFVKFHDGVILDIYTTYYKVALSITLSALCFFVFSKFFNQQSDMIKKFSEASYTVYIFHQPIVVILGMICIHYSMPAIIGFPVIAFVAFTLTITIHFYLVKKFKILSYCFNGKRS